jgi:hypothetical protein
MTILGISASDFKRVLALDIAISKPVQAAMGEKLFGDSSSKGLATLPTLVKPNTASFGFGRAEKADDMQSLAPSFRVHAHGRLVWAGLNRHFERAGDRRQILIESDTLIYLMSRPS